jgi:exodeoxyribonuclease VII small subunit
MVEGENGGVMARRKAGASAEGLSFEKKLAELEGIVARLESGENPLEEALALFEKGTGLLRELAKTLEEAERKVEVLTRGPDGKLVLAPFRPDAGEADAQGGEPGDGE